MRGGISLFDNSHLLTVPAHTGTVVGAHPGLLKRLDRKCLDLPGQPPLAGGTLNLTTAVGAPEGHSTILLSLLSKER
jgi:hypothetical protein